MEKYINIELKIENKVGYLIFNRPENLNAMNRLMMDEIIHGIEVLNQKEQVHVAIITGKGRAFMAGADIKEYGSQTEEQFASFQERGRMLYKLIEEAPKPWLAAVNGFALGGGFEIALACDMILASDGSKMGLPEVFLSLVPGGGGTQRLIQRMSINRAKEMLFTGGQYSANTLAEWGVVNHVFEEDSFETEVSRFAQKLTRRPAGALSQLKRLAHLSLSTLPFEQKIEEEGKTVSSLFHGIEAKKAIQNFIDKSN